MKLPNYPSRVYLVDQLGIDTRLQVDILLHRIMTDSIDTNQAGIHHAHHDISLMMQDHGLQKQKHNTWVYIWPDKIGDRNNGPTNTEMQTTFWAWTAQP